MKNFGVWCAFAVLGILMGKEFLEWVWWYNWEDNENEENPAPLLCVAWAVWQVIGKVVFWLWLRVWRPPQNWLRDICRRFFPPATTKEPVDRDGRAPTEWLLIGVIGVWDMENWYKDEYDWEVKRKWDEFLKTRNATEHPETEEQRSPESAD